MAEDNMKHDNVQRGGEISGLFDEQGSVVREVAGFIGAVAVAATVPIPRLAIAAENYPTEAKLASIRRLQPVEPPLACEAIEHDAACDQLALGLYWPPDDTWSDFECRLGAGDIRATRQLFANIAEILDGRRPLVQLQDRLHPNVYAAMETRVRNSLTMQGLCLHSVHACRPAEDFIEACATLTQRERARAMVARLEARRTGWLCTVLRLV
jgi:hypothetical protein